MRAAVVHAFNSKAMLDTFFLGTTVATTDLLGSNSEWHCPKLNWRGYDLAKARALVASVGKPIKFQLVSTNTPAGRRQAGMVQQFVKEAGMEAEISQSAFDRHGTDPAALARGGVVALVGPRRHQVFVEALEVVADDGRAREALEQRVVLGARKVLPGCERREEQQPGECRRGQQPKEGEDGTRTHR